MLGRPLNRLVLPATLSAAVLSTGCASSPAGSDAGDDASGTHDVAMETSTPPCADPDALPTAQDLGCWTCEDPATSPYPGMPECGTCTNPHATQQPRGGCALCPGDGGERTVYC